MRSIGGSRVHRGLLAPGVFLPHRIVNRSYHSSPVVEEAPDGDNDFILSILQASPSVRDSRSYLSSFAPSSSPPLSTEKTTLTPSIKPHPILSSILNPTPRRPALVKIQGPFTDPQLASIAKGMARLQKLGLVSVIVIDRDDLPPFEPTDSSVAQKQREMVMREMERVVDFLIRYRAPARPILASVARVGDQGVFVEAEGLDHVRRAVEEGEIPVLLPVALDMGCRSRRVHSNLVLTALAKAMVNPPISSLSQMTSTTSTISHPSSLTRPTTLSSIHATPSSVYPPTLSSSSSSASPSNDHSQISTTGSSHEGHTTQTKDNDISYNTVDPIGTIFKAKIDLTPLRLLIINREGGIPSYARSGLPHLSINLSSEYNHINSTFLPSWHSTHPTALSNLSLAHTCLRLMPRDASALIVSHRSPAALIANLITNKPAHSISLPHALLESGGRLTRDTPTLIRTGLPVRIVRDFQALDIEKLTNLLETSFRRKLNREKYWDRMKKDMDFCIIIGDYAGAAIVTSEGRSPSSFSAPSETEDKRLKSDPLNNERKNRQNPQGICYLDKFAVHPEHQGDGTVDFLWVSLRDETYGLGVPDSANPTEGSLRSVPHPSRLTGRDLVWRSRSDNPVNRWYFERSSGFVSSQDGRWKVFWCDAEERVDPVLRKASREQSQAFSGGSRYEMSGVSRDGGGSVNGKYDISGGHGGSVIEGQYDKACGFGSDGNRSSSGMSGIDRNGPEGERDVAEGTELGDAGTTDERDFGGGRMIKVIEDDEKGRVERWEPVISGIESAWL
ncbi:amino-acid acetyltransferase, mitochondrial [Tremella mesenterica]|uniref:Amino-acid acetyltransferase, mitochondrial n=1 Tax=Tremella mesenterica TaxID=5217 RepID=A0A4Q1BVE8_TREME|nr:amino-acid acetyltransferase, mitochondrial [Tremella mesenterica]